MEPESVFERLRKLIASGEALAAAEGIRDLIGGLSKDGQSTVLWSGRANEIAIQIARIVRLGRDQRSNILSRGDAERERSSIDAALLEIVDDVERLSVSRLPIREQPVEFSRDALGLSEKILGPVSHLKSLSWLHRGLACAKAVCRILSPSGMGSGFVVGNGILLTNNHVISSREEAARTVVEFNFEDDESGNIKKLVRYSLESSLFVTSDVLDCTAVKIDQGESLFALDEWGSLTLEQGRIELEEHVTIIQHPNGGIKQICLTENKVVNVSSDRIQYTTDTMPGSSGSPVFNDRWKVVALHHQGGNLIKSNRGGRIFANQGVKISSILSHSEFREVIYKNACR